MPSYRYLSTPRTEFSEADTFDALKVLGVTRRNRGEITSADIGRVVDLVGITAGVNHEGRQNAVKAISTMLATEVAQEQIVLGSMDVEVPQAVQEYAERIREIGEVAATHELIERMMPSA